MTAAVLLLLLAGAVRAAEPSPAERLTKIRSDISDGFRYSYELERDAGRFSVFWRAHVDEVLAARRDRPGEAVFLSSSRRESMYYDWVSRRNVDAVAANDLSWFKLDDYERRAAFDKALEGRERDLAWAIQKLDEREDLIRYRDWLLATTPQSPAVWDALRRSSDLMAQGRRDEALSALKALGPEADFVPEAILARAMARMADGRLSLPDDEWDRFYEALGAQDPQGVKRELSWEFLCLAEQSRTENWKFGTSYGGATDRDWDGFISSLGLTASASDAVELRDFLRSHPSAGQAAIEAVRRTPACGTVRVAADGSADADTIAGGLKLLAPFGGKGRILLAPGRYPESVSVASSRVLIRSITPGAALILPPAGLPALDIRGADGVVVDGVSMRARNANVVEVRSSRGITLKRCRLEAPGRPRGL